jgi:hypothetical protein
MFVFVRQVLPIGTECGTTERCERTLGAISSSEFNERKVNVGSQKCQNNCSSTAGSLDTYTVSKNISLGYNRSELWQNSNSFTIGVGIKPVGVEYTNVTNVGGETVMASTTITQEITLSAQAGKKLCKQYYAKLVDFEYTQTYQYKYTRTDSVNNGSDCVCVQGTGFNCVNVTSESGTVKVTGTRSKEEGVDITETNAINCGG